ncbi:MAG TPA: hypothetical protein PLQ91_04330 [Bacteroidales bacterium]|nr:hypothetical protein [Bacteroidales bacterium]HXK91146.1 hypothetical protein [Bacteroidales bacterium]
MRKNSIIVMLMVATFLFLTSCSKYEEGPIISFRSKTERLCNIWKPVKILVNGSETILSSDQQKTTIEFQKDGDAFITAYYLGIPVAQTGQWEFYDNSKKIILTMNTDDNTPSKDTLKILKLMEEELWLEGKIDSDILEYHLEPK